MPISPRCDFKIAENCEGDIKHFGALLFSPPNENNMVRKYHICINCFNKLKEEYGLSPRK